MSSTATSGANDQPDTAVPNTAAPVAPATAGSDAGTATPGSGGTTFDLADSDRDLREALRQIRHELTEGEGPLDFSPPGAAELLRTNTRLTKEIGVRAIRLARLDRLDYVSRPHVESATRELIGRDAQAQRTGPLTLGSLLLGAGVPELLNLLFAEPAPPRFRVALMVVGMVAGAFLLAYGLNPARRRK